MKRSQFLAMLAAVAVAPFVKTDSIQDMYDQGWRQEKDFIGATFRVSGWWFQETRTVIHDGNTIKWIR